MGAESQTNGIIYCENKLGVDIKQTLSDLYKEQDFWRCKNDEDYLFSFSINEIQLSKFHDLLQT